MSTPATAAEIFESIRVRVRTGELQPGDALPPVRELAVQLGVNRNTVASAYKKLVAAGIALTNGRYGTTVKADGPLPEQEGPDAATLLVDISGGDPQRSLLPDLTPLLKAVSAVPRNYGDPPINPGLEQRGREWFAPDVPGDFALTMTHGAVDAIERLVSGYLAIGEKVAVEEPCFLSSINTLRSLGFEPVGVPVDGEGLQPGPLRTVLEAGAQVLIVTPRAHNPTGCSLSEARAAAIRSVLSDFPQVMVIVDDHFSLLSVDPYHPPIPVSTRNWAIVRSFSKFYGPDLRMAMVASNTETTQRLWQRLAAGTHWVSHILQDIAEKAFDSAVVQRRVQQASQCYLQSKARLIAALGERGIDVNARYDGVNLWLRLAQPETALVSHMAEKGWRIRPGSGFYLTRPLPAIRLTPAGLNDRQIEQLVRDLISGLAATGNRIVSG